MQPIGLKSLNQPIFAVAADVSSSQVNIAAVFS